MTNPLLTARDLPAFADIRPEHIGPALDVLLPEAEAALERAVGAATATQYEALSRVLDVPLERLSRAWNAVAHLNAVVNTAELRQAYNDNLARVTDLHTRLGADERLYAKYKAMAEGARASTPTLLSFPLSAPRQRALSNAIRDFVLSGAELQGAARERFAAIQARHAEVAQQFSEHVLDATDGFSLLATEAQLAGVPDDILQATRAAAQADGLQGHKITLQQPTWLPVMQYALDRELRQQLYHAHVTRASEFGPPERDNSAAMAELLALRQEEAQLLGHASYAELSLVPKMAQSPEQVNAFLRDLAARARPHALRDVEELKRFAADRLGLKDLAHWDQALVSEKLKEERYAFSEQAVKQYFTEPRVLQGLFDLIETLFGVTIRADSAPVWHDTVRFFRIERAVPSQTGGASTAQLVGQFYLDLYARSGKRPGAWMDDVRGRWRRPDAALPNAAAQTPVAQLVCNFAAPVGDKPALLTHDDVITLFHEFGHGLQHMLTQVDDLAVSGIAGVEWDAVELPSQFMENFCWEWKVLARMSAHVDTGEPLPRELFERMLAARNFQCGLQTVRQIEFALFDMRLHSEPDASGRVQAILDEVRHEVAVQMPPAYNRYQHTFSHIFAGGYAAGYYSYKWAEVLSADAFAAFEEAGVFDAATGERYRREILESGGSRPAMESFKAFRGREPRIDALLRHQGMAVETP